MTGLRMATILAIQNGRERGMTARQIAEEYGYHYATICRYRRALGIKDRAGIGQDADLDARTNTMLALYRDGYTLQQIGDQYGLSRERVRQCLTKYRGVRADGGGARVQAQRTAEARQRRAMARCLAVYGCTVEQRDTILRKGGSKRSPMYFYKNQRNAALHRGIGWEFTPWAWWLVWESSGHWSERGRGQGYCMCRFGDQGPYSPSNVFIAPARVNSSDQARKKSGLPIGVIRKEIGSYVTFIAHRAVAGRKYHLGSFKTPELAHAAYLSFVPPSQTVTIGSFATKEEAGRAFEQAAVVVHGEFARA